MSIVTLFEQLVNTPYHKVNLDILLENEPTCIQKAFANNDAACLKSFFNENNNILADRNTVFQL